MTQIFFPHTAGSRTTEVDGNYHIGMKGNCGCVCVGGGGGWGVTINNGNCFSTDYFSELTV